MITRLKIDGFKNLVDVDIQFGAFTCIAGTNAVGKSNLFDAIRFLSDLTHKTLVDAAKSVRSEGQKNSDIRDIFHKVGNIYAEKMSFEVDMILPKTGIDDFGQQATATTTAVQYKLVLGYKKVNDIIPQGDLEIIEEWLTPIKQSEALDSIKFHDNSDFRSKPNKEQNEIKRKETEWKKSIITGFRRNSVQFISTEGENENRKINFHQDGGSSGKPAGRMAKQLPKTILSSANAVENPTTLIAKNEMKSWILLQLEPSALRKSDEFNSIKNARLSEDGSHLPATLYRLKTENPERDIYQQLANRLSELIEGVKDIDIDKDEKRELLTLILKSKDNTPLPARALSDGTLRFLGLSVLELDSKSAGVICLEEPENGIHPEKIAAMLKLLQDIAMDTTIPVNEDNPMRQVIINTHSPLVVQQVPEESLLVAELKESTKDDNVRFKKSVFSALENTWRTRKVATLPLFPQKDLHTISKGTLLAYLSATVPPIDENTNNESNEGDFIPSSKAKRVIDRKDVQDQLLLF
jgi:predicted ATPase